MQAAALSSAAGTDTPAPGLSYAWPRMFPGIKLALLAACALTVPLAAGAHAHLLRSTPAAASVLAVAPAQLQLDFSETAVLTSLSLERSGDPVRQKLTPRPGAPQARLVIELPPLVAGSYLVRWRALSADGHISSGSFGFTLQAK